MMEYTVLIDADILCYNTAAANEDVTQWDDDIWTVSGDAKVAKWAIDHAIENIVDVTGAVDYKLCLTGSTNFRKDVYPDYKGNRKDKRKPVLLQALREHLMENHPVELWEGLEADDVMGILASEPTLGHTHIIYSQDKDMQTIPAVLWDLDDNVPFFVPEETADYNFYLQTLTGDVVDGYPGCPGVGKVTAKKALDVNCSWQTVVDLYEKKGLTEADALVQARCARILRYEDYDVLEGKVKLWEPSK